MQLAKGGPHSLQHCGTAHLGSSPSSACTQDACLQAHFTHSASFLSQTLAWLRICARLSWIGNPALLPQSWPICRRMPPILHPRVGRHEQLWSCRSRSLRSAQLWDHCVGAAGTLTKHTLAAWARLSRPCTQSWIYRVCSSMSSSRSGHHSFVKVYVRDRHRHSGQAASTGAEPSASIADFSLSSPPATGAALLLMYNLC